MQGEQETKTGLRVRAPHSLFLALAADPAHWLRLCPKDKTASCSSKNKLNFQLKTFNYPIRSSLDKEYKTTQSFLQIIRNPPRDSLFLPQFFVLISSMVT